MKCFAGVDLFTRVTAVALGVGLGGALVFAQEQAPTAGSSAVPPAKSLSATRHVRLPREASQLWMAPDALSRSHAKTPAATELQSAVKLEVDSNFAKALPILEQPSVQQGTLGGYAQLYAGLAELRLGRPADARKTFIALRDRQPVGYLAEGAALREAEADEALTDPAAALAIYESLSKSPTTAPDDVLMRLARAAKATGDTDKAANAFARVVYEYPLSDLAPLAATEMESLPNVQAISPGSPRFALELGRAERLFGSKRYAQARTAFEGLKSASSGDDRELVSLRLAECDYFLKRPRNARDGVRPYIERASRQGEALFFYAIAERELGDHDEYVHTVRRIVNEFPAQSWAEEALNNLATSYILQDDDEHADQVFRELYEKFPSGHYAERAAWKIGWFAYKNHKYEDAVRVFERAAADFPHADYRPSWLYWAGRAHDALGDRSSADARYMLVATDYLNSYYGRLAMKRIAERGGRAPGQRLVIGVDRDADGYDTDPSDTTVAPPLPPNAATIRALLSLELYDQGIDELHYAQKVWGDSPAIQATLGWIANRRGDLRAGINAIKRAYPQYMAAGGEQIPTEILKVLFPVNYWPLIRRYSAAHDLDPYLIAALIAQESTFTADVRSAANAYGLMQIVPSTGRIYARRLNMRRFSIGLLTTAEPNLKLGTAYFADLVRQFGGAHFALASYNAGESRIVRWKAERPDFDREEFIDDIPFPETQNYVKKILGTADDYRRLYGGDASGDDDLDVAPAVATGKPAPVKKAAATAASKSKASRAKTAKKPSTSHKKKSRRSRKAA